MIAAASAVLVVSGQMGGTDCETLRGGLLAQPSNTATSAAYIVAALYVWLRLPSEHRRGAGLAYAVLLALVGIGSILYHGPQPIGARNAHDVPIAAVLMLIVGLVLIRRRDGRRPLPGFTRGRAVVLAAAALVGLLAYFLGRTGAALCDPGSLAQAHGLWHVCTAAVFAVAADMLFVTPGRGAPVRPPRAQGQRSD